MEPMTIKILNEAKRNHLLEWPRTDVRRPKTISGTRTDIRTRAPIGVDLDIVVEALTEHLKEMDYATNLIRLTSLMKEVPTSISLPAASYVASYRHRIAYANDVRRRLGDDAMAAMAISAIRSHRAQEWNLKTAEERRDGLGKSGHAEETPLASHACMIRQFKRPDEIRLMRGVYGRQFIVVSAFSPQEIRLRRIRDIELRSHGGLISEVSAHNSAYELISRDSREIQNYSWPKRKGCIPVRAMCSSMRRRDRLASRL